MTPPPLQGSTGAIGAPLRFLPVDKIVQVSLGEVPAQRAATPVISESPIAVLSGRLRPLTAAFYSPARPFVWQRGFRLPARWLSLVAFWC